MLLAPRASKDQGQQVLFVNQPVHLCLGYTTHNTGTLQGLGDHMMEDIQEITQ